MENVNNSYISVGKSVRSILDYYDMDNVNDNIDIILEMCIDYIEVFGFEVDCYEFDYDLIDDGMELFYLIYNNKFNDLEIGKKVIELFNSR